jgi:hypothetical protein
MDHTVLYPRTVSSTTRLRPEWKVSINLKKFNNSKLNGDAFIGSTVAECGLATLLQRPRTLQMSLPPSKQDRPLVAVSPELIGPRGAVEPWFEARY